ncbi:MAG: DCC1-like thiol-disulfide oxidoreductase family protein [Alphaproteobacteria bacterium]|nr:DCC1-like thiol-disulfide oxidoreductase family protein [Alphaproteobacteria bacterium]
MSNSWTGGQYSIFRMLFGFYLFVHFAYLAFWAPDIFSNAGMVPDAALSPLRTAFPNILSLIDEPWFVSGLAAFAAVAALFFAVGSGDRIAAVFMWFALACFLGRNPLITNPAMPYTGWMLLAHLFIPTAPYGSLAARGRTDPGNRWELPTGVFLAGWVILALTYSYSGYTKLLSPSWVAGDNIGYVLTNPLARDWFLRDLFLALPPMFLKLLTWFILAIELLFAPLALIRRLRPWLWFGMLFVQFGFAFLLRFPDLTIAMLLFHLFTFNPDWLKAKSLAGTRIFFDGNCALCHGTIRFLLAEEHDAALRFAPLQGGLLAQQIGEEKVVALGDTFVTVTPNGRILTESDGMIHLLDHLGGLWRIVAWTVRIVPASLRNRLYHFIGDRRYTWFGSKDDFCPVLPPHLRQRILLPDR